MHMVKRDSENSRIKPPIFRVTHPIGFKARGFSHLHRGSHSSWKTWKNDNSLSSPGKVLEFYNFIKNPGKMGVNLEKNCLGKK